MVLVIGVALVAALVFRQSSSVAVARRLTIVAMVALGIRLLAVTAIYFIAIRTHAEGTFFNDEASFYLATESLMPNPLDKALPQGLEHLGTDGYLGVLTAISVALGSSFGHMNTVAFRLTNATLGALVAVTSSMLAAHLVGKRAALIAGLVVAVWPTLVLWSATFLRDTLCSFIVVVVWWTLTTRARVTDTRVVGVVILGLALLAGLRPYLGGAMAIGVAAWSLWPFLTRRSPPQLAIGVAACAVVCAGGAILEARHIDEAAHQLVYRQMTTRMETLGLLYHDKDPNAPLPDPPFFEGAAVAVVDPGSNWIAPGLIERSLGPGRVQVAFTDGSERDMQLSDLVLLQSAPLSPLQLLTTVQPGVVAFITGMGEGSNPGWTADAVAWDVLFVIAVVGGLRARVPWRDWLLPASIVLGTAAALILVPGAPGNDDRHRASQAVPLLVVFAAAWVASRWPTVIRSGTSLSKATISPITAGTAASSRSRSLREPS